MSLWEEIASQPAVLGELVDRGDERITPAVQWLSGHEFNHVLIAARGSSDNAARYAQYLWGARNRLLVSLAAPSLFSMYGTPPVLDQALAVGISQSGESPDLLAVLDAARAQLRPTLGITNNPDSPMALRSDFHIALGIGPEKAVAATKSYTAQLTTLALLAASMAGDAEMRGQLGHLRDLVAGALETVDVCEAAAAALRDTNRCVVLGRGFHHATAHEWALKIAELSYLVAQPFSTADFRHGPLAMVEPGLPVLAVATEGPAYRDVANLLVSVRDAGALVVAISDHADCPADHVILLPPGTPGWLAPIPAIVAAQVFTYHLTVARGLDPDNPRRLSKVTKTL
jgi:glucosamine--fructose-6-phosphate aminotransferase (isomerizing)